MEPKIVFIETEPLSHLQTQGSLILCACILAVVVISNILERWVLAKVYGALWEDLSLGHNERRRRSFTYLHIGVMIMGTLVVLGCYPVFDFLVGHARPSTVLMRPGRFHVTYGDAMFILSQIYSAYYLFEVSFRTRFASAIGIAHHVGLLIVIQSALALFGNPKKHPEAILEFYMCMVWGAFDVVVELPLYTFMILWRIKSSCHRLLSRLAYACFVWVLLGATIETAITIWLMNRSWHRWSLCFKVLLPAVFGLWITTQLYGATRILSMARTKQRLAAGHGTDDSEGAISREESREGKNQGAREDLTNGDANRDVSFQLDDPSSETRR